METIEAMKARHARAVEKLEKELACAQRLPLLPDSICAQRDEVWATYRAPEEPGRYTPMHDRALPLADALAIVRTYRDWEHGEGIAECEQWHLGCVSTVPLALTAPDYVARGKFLGAHDVELRLERASYGTRDELSFHVRDRRDGQWYRVIVHVRSGVEPRVDARWRGDVCVRQKYLVPEPAPAGVVRARKWSFGDGFPREVEEGCHVSLYWKLDAFEAWAEKGGAR